MVIYRAFTDNLLCLPALLPRPKKAFCQQSQFGVVAGTRNTLEKEVGDTWVLLAAQQQHCPRAAVVYFSLVFNLLEAASGKLHTFE